MREQKHRARFGPAWWDRNSHIGIMRDGRPVVLGFDDAGNDFPWPRPCPVCVELLTED